MTRMFRAELLKLRRRRLVIGVIAGAVGFAVLSTLTVFLSAAEPGERVAERGASIESLGQAGGATEAFSLGASFIGILVLVLFIANFAGEFTQGTFRTLLMRQPRRAALLAGKMAALLAFVAVVMFLGEILTVIASTVLAPTQDISTRSWFSLDGLGEAAGDYATSMLGVSSWAAFGMALAIFVRSIPIGLGIGIVWSGPFEHLVADAWSAGSHWFPGLLLEALAAGGTPDVSVTRSLTLVGIYVAAVVSAAAVIFARRDVTA